MFDNYLLIMGRLTLEQKNLFKRLHDKKVNDKNVLMDEEYIGLFAEAIDKYSDSAHFIYELLQNADDANATEVNIILKPEKLIFKHNGTRHFNITEKGVKPQGDINAITGIGFSNKKNDLSTENKIGKFGLGFKSVLQYTDTPEIYDDVFKFKIENMIVPTLLEYDYPDRQDGETLFVLPFKQDKTKQCFREIKERLETLDNPLLFLNNLKKVIWRIDATERNNGRENFFDKILLEQTQYKQNIELSRYDLRGGNKDNHIFLFSQQITIEGESHKIFVGFYYDLDNKCLITNQEQKIHCFFPTNETFETCFVTHAPFLLTNSRQNLKPSESANTSLLTSLAALAAKSVVLLRDYGIHNKHLLIDENIVDIIPKYNKSYYYYTQSYNFEDIMASAFEDILEDEPLMLSRNNNYMMLEDSYITTNALYELISQEQFVYLHGVIEEEDDDDYYYDDDGEEDDIEIEEQETEYNENIDFLKWELRMKISELKNSVTIYSSINDFSVEDLANDISVSFMEKQKIEWVTRFYTFLRNDAPKYWKITPQSKNTAHFFRHAPIIKTQEDTWVKPYIDLTTPNVFIPLNKEQSVNSSDDYNFIHEEYLNDDMASKFFSELEIGTPDEYNYITAVILNRYRHDIVNDEGLIDDFIVLIQYYVTIKDNEQKLSEYLNILRRDLYVLCTDKKYRQPDIIYYNSTILRRYFSSYEKHYRKYHGGTPDIYYLNENYYKKIKLQFNDSIYYEFFNLLGVARYPRMERLSHSYNWSIRANIQQSYQEKALCQDFNLEGLSDLLQSSTDEKIDKELSLYLWNEVLPQADCERYKEMTVKYRVKYARDYTYVRFDSELIYILKNTLWIYDRDGNLHTTQDIIQENLAEEYNLYNGNIQLLGIEKRQRDLTKLGATDEEQENFDLGSRIKQEMGDDLSEEEALQAIRQFKAQKQRVGSSTKFDSIDESDNENNQKYTLDSIETNKQITNVSDEENRNNHDKERAVLDKLRKESSLDTILHKQNKYSADQLFDEAPDNLPTINTNKNQSASLTDEQIAAIQQQEETRKSLEEIAVDESKRYTYEWFNALLELEFRKSGEATSSKSGLHIIFSKVEKDPHSERGVLLRNPSRYIPRSIEECTNITVVFYLPNDIHPSISFEVASVQDYVLRLKCKNEDIEAVDNLLAVANQVYLAELKTDTPIKLIERLQSAYTELGYEDEYSLRDNINPTVKFVFGPPGTGKTTYLVKKWINKIATRPAGKMLVLCPTNKAADVIAQRALEKLHPASHPETWLYRFVQTAEDSLENNVCLRDSSIYKQDKCCVISTIARFAYDGFEGAKLKDIDWDVIVIDEASMITLAEIVYPIYKCENAQIVIAGDPFQIEPIVNEELWKDENIYKMIQLDNFQNPQTVPCNFDIVNLDTQYRAVPAIGRLYSEYTYDGAIKSYREQASQRNLILKGFEPKSVNFVMFPVSRTSIYEPHLVVNSSVHIYSALFTFEFIKYLAANIDGQTDEKPWRIGVISPYRAQAEIINKLWEQRSESYNNVDVQIGTVHGFQGDECDIIVAVYNPAARGMKRNAGNVFVNKKNILNVAISRAQDYLFLLMPDGDYEDYNHLEAKAIGVIAKKNPSEMTIANSQTLEKVMHGDLHYLDKNTFVTVHQLANVYSDPSSKYEVRFDEKSVDIQIK